METKTVRISLKDTIVIIIKSIKISFKTKGAMSIIISFLGFAAAFLPVLVSTTLRDFADKIQTLATSTDKDLAGAYTIFALLAGLFIAQAVYNFFHSYTLGIDAMKTKKYINQTVLKYTCDVKYKYIENYDNFMEKISFASTYAGFRVASSMQTIIVWFQNIITFISIFYVLNSVNMWIVMILLVTCIPSVILAYHQKDETYRYNMKWMKEGAMVIHYFHICAGEAAMQEIRHLGIFDYLKFRWREIADTYINIKNNMTKKHVLYNSGADFLRNAVYIGVLLITSSEIYKNPVIGLGTFMLVFTLSGQMQDVTSKLLVTAAQFSSDIHYMKDFFDLEKLERDIINENSTALDDIKIKFENVNFTYPKGKERALKDINITISNGEKIAIVGENGSGKSTFVNLLCGMYEPDSGVIKINDIDIRENLSTVRRSISAVFQDFGHYEASLRENITISDKGKNASDDELLYLVKRTNAYDIIENQPGKLDEEIGLFSKTGNNLSGGQWQKIAITRAVYRNKAKIMILDEPTSALDPLAETQLYSDFANLTSDKTTILISHRLGITSVVDRILVFRDGKIIEDGGHKELLANGGYYAEMYATQAKWYDDTAQIS